MSDGQDDKSNVPMPPKVDLQKEIGSPAPPPAPPLRTEPVLSIPTPKVEVTVRPPSPEERSQTVHISIPELESVAPSTRGTVQPAGQALPPPTIRTERAGPRIPTQAPQPQASTDAKRKTSRLPLDAAQPAPSPARAMTGETPKTIRIKPVAAGGTLAIPKAAITTPPQTSAGEKKKTSRISLEAALVPEEVAGGEKRYTEGGPKTIRLRRPAVAEAAPLPGSTAPQPAMEETARIVEAPTEGSSPTKRRTIKVRRPGDASGSQISVARSGLPGQAQVDAAALVARADQPSVAFPIFAAVAILVTCVLLYLLAAQSFGRNPCLSQVTMGNEPDLYWPGKIQTPLEP